MKYPSENSKPLWRGIIERNQNARELRILDDGLLVLLCGIRINESAWREFIDALLNDFLPGCGEFAETRVLRLRLTRQANTFREGFSNGVDRHAHIVWSRHQNIES